MKRRAAERERETRETKIRLALDIDGFRDASDASRVSRFFDHMLEALARHARF